MKAGTGSPGLPYILMCQACHGLRPRGSMYRLAICACTYFDFRLVNNVVLPVCSVYEAHSLQHFGLRPACLLSLRLKKAVTRFPPKTCYPVNGHPSGTGLAPVRIYDLARPHLLFRGVSPYQFKYYYKQSGFNCYKMIYNSTGTIMGSPSNADPIASITEREFFLTVEI